MLLSFRNVKPSLIVRAMVLKTYRKVWNYRKYKKKHFFSSPRFCSSDLSSNILMHWFPVLCVDDTMLSPHVVPSSVVCSSSSYWVWNHFKLLPSLTISFLFLSVITAKCFCVVCGVCVCSISILCCVVVVLWSSSCYCWIFFASLFRMLGACFWKWNFWKILTPYGVSTRNFFSKVMNF